MSLGKTDRNWNILNNGTRNDFKALPAIPEPVIQSATETYKKLAEMVYNLEQFPLFKTIDYTKLGKANKLNKPIIIDTPMLDLSRYSGDMGSLQSSQFQPDSTQITGQEAILSYLRLVSQDSGITFDANHGNITGESLLAFEIFQGSGFASSQEGRQSIADFNELLQEYIADSGSDELIRRKAGTAKGYLEKWIRIYQLYNYQIQDVLQSITPIASEDPSIITPVMNYQSFQANLAKLVAESRKRNLIALGSTRYFALLGKNVSIPEIKNNLLTFTEREVPYLVFDWRGAKVTDSAGAELDLDKSIMVIPEGSMTTYLGAGMRGLHNKQDGTYVIKNVFLDPASSVIVANNYKPILNDVVVAKEMV